MMRNMTTLRELAVGDDRYAAIYWYETGDASLLSAGPAWPRSMGADPDQHERHDSAVAALDAAMAEVEEMYRLGQEHPEVWVLFGGDPNTDNDPYPDVAVAVDDDGVLRIGVC